MKHKQIHRIKTNIVTVFILITIGFIGFIECEDSIDNSKVTATTTLYVGGTGPGNFSKIQLAIDSAETGDTIFVWSGMYNENIWINRTLSLKGNGSTNTIINGSARSSVITIQANYVNISGFKITGDCYSGYGRWR